MYQRELEFALKAAHAAGDLLRDGFHAGFPKALDRAADECIHGILSPAFPEYGYRSEELGIVQRPAGPQLRLWLVDPQDGTSAAHQGYRGAAVSIALLREGRPVLGVVYAYCAPDDNGDLFWWVEGQGPVRHNGNAVTRAWPDKPTAQCTVLVSQHADHNAEANSKLASPMRYRCVVGIAYRLALVASGEGDLGVSLNSPTGWDMGAGHALLRGAGGELFDQSGSPVTYDRYGSLLRPLSFFFGGSPALAKTMCGSDYSGAFHTTGKSAANSLAFLKSGQTVRDAGMLARAQGCLMGQLSGDSLGSLVEFQLAGEISRQYGDGPKFLEDGGSWDTIGGQPTDDSELALALARSIVQEGGYQEEAAARAYARWHDSDPFDIGGTINLALSAASEAMRHNRPAAKAARKAANTASQANGALMRISPLGIYSAALPSETVFDLGSVDAALTHPHPVCRAASGLFAAAIAHAIRSGDAAGAVYDHVLQLARRLAVPNSLLERLLAARESPPGDYITKQGWVLIAFQNAFFRLLHAGNLQSGVVDTVRCGGDTDTNAAIAGALLGAVHGRQSIPRQWADRVLTCRPVEGLRGVRQPRPPCYWPVDALVLAERLIIAAN